MTTALRLCLVGAALNIAALIFTLSGAGLWTLILSLVGLGFVSVGVVLSARERR